MQVERALLLGAKLRRQREPKKAKASSVPLSEWSCAGSGVPLLSRHELPDACGPLAKVRLPFLLAQNSRIAPHLLSSQHLFLCNRPWTSATVQLVLLSAVDRCEALFRAVVVQIRQEIREDERCHLWSAMGTG